MSKILFLEIKCCSDCPYLDFSFDYGMGYDSGWDCHHPDAKCQDRRIIDEGELHALKDHDGPKLPEDAVPDWCPLPDRDDIVDFGSDTLIDLLRSVKCPENV